MEIVTQTGALVVSQFIAGGAFENWQLFRINYDGGSSEEIGVGFTRVSDGTAFYQIWRRVGGTLQLETTKNISVPGFGGHVYRVADFDADGNEEIFVGFQRLSDNVTFYQSWEPQTSTLISSKALTGSSFSGHEFVPGNFDAGKSGDEILVGFQRASDGRAIYWVIDEVGTTTGIKAVATSSFVDFDWQAISAGATDLIFLGMQRASDGRPVYTLWNPVAGSLVGASFVAGAATTLVQWVTGNFDGNAVNNHEILVGYLRNSDGATLFQTYTQAGSFVGGATALGGNFVNPQFTALRAGGTTHSVYIGAQLSGGAPVIQIWTGAGISMLSKFIFNGDVV